MQPQPTNHDVLFWSAIVQAFGSVAIVLATAALVWVTLKLVNATEKLAMVGEQTWKSNIKPKVWIGVEEGVISQAPKAILKFRNACAVRLTNARVTSYPLVFSLGPSGKYIADAAPIQDRTSVMTQIGDIELDGVLQYNFWDDALRCLDFPVLYPKAISHPSSTDNTVVCGVAFSVAFTHGVTNELFHKVFKISVEDAGKASLRVREIQDLDAQPI